MISRYRLVVTIQSDTTEIIEIERKGFFGWRKIERIECGKASFYGSYDKAMDRMKKYAEFKR
jgi:hypothetical protein